MRKPATCVSPLELCPGFPSSSNRVKINSLFIKIDKKQNKRVPKHRAVRRTTEMADQASAPPSSHTGPCPRRAGQAPFCLLVSGPLTKRVCPLKSRGEL